MKTISQYREDITNLMKKVGDMDAKCIAESREPNSDEILLKNEMMDAVEGIRTNVETLERQERMRTLLETPNVPETKPAPSGIKVGEDRSAKDKFGSFGEQMMSVMRAGISGGFVDPRLYNTRAVSGLGESVPSDGGFLVQQDFVTGLMEDVFETGKLAAKCDKIQVSGNASSIKINGVDETSRASSRSGGVIGYWLEEAGQKTASKPKFRKIELNLNKMIGLCYATDELLDDAMALEGVVRKAFVDEFGFMLDDAIINGTGAGQPLGVLNAGCLVSVAKETGQDAGTIVAENIMKMRSRLFASSRGSAVWLINQNAEPQLHQMSLAVGTGGVPVYMPAGGLSGQPYDTLYGIPIMPIEQCATVGTVGDIILADFSKGYMLAEKGGMKSDVSIHVRFDYDESVFRFVYRVDGQPKRATALTPYKGGANFTQSHFVALASR